MYKIQSIKRTLHYRGILFKWEYTACNGSNCVPGWVYAASEQQAKLLADEQLILLMD
jgi:hypothetical protein